MAKKKEKVIAFGMTMADIEKTTAQLLKHKDVDYPPNTSTYKDFLDVKNKGHSVLLKHEGYGKGFIK